MIMITFGGWAMYVCKSSEMYIIYFPIIQMTLSHTLLFNHGCNSIVGHYVSNIFSYSLYLSFTCKKIVNYILFSNLHISIYTSECCFLIMQLLLFYLCCYFTADLWKIKVLLAQSFGSICFTISKIGWGICFSFYFACCFKAKLFKKLNLVVLSLLISHQGHGQFLPSQGQT